MHRWLPLVLIFGLAAAFRLLGTFVPDFPLNFQPLAAMFFCGAFLIPGWRGFAVPALVWMVTYLAPLAIQGYAPVASGAAFATTLVAFFAMYLLGRSLANRGSASLLAGSVAGAVLFHLLTNGAAWLGSPVYANNLGGLWQSVWTGPPGAPVPSWVFLRNLAVANGLFTAVILAARWHLPAAPPQAVGSLAR